MIPINFDQKRLRVAATDPSGVVGTGTVLHFTQTGRQVSASYRGGAIVDGYLAGFLREDLRTLDFCYVQTDLQGNIDAGRSVGVADHDADGRLRVVEHFQWFTRPEHGQNVFEEIDPA